jgi:hypothetical protein
MKKALKLSLQGLFIAYREIGMLCIRNRTG